MSANLKQLNPGADQAVQRPRGNGTVDLELTPAHPLTLRQDAPFVQRWWFCERKACCPLWYSMAFGFPSRVVGVLSPLGVVIDSPERDSRVPRSRTTLFIPTLQLLASGNMVRLSRRGTGPTRVIDGSSLLAGCLARHPTPGQA
jgi:hypothetical protein